MARQREDNVDFEVRFYEKILERKPDFIEALMALGDLYTKQGKNEAGLKVDQRLALLRPDDDTVLYNLACSYSLVNNIDEAFIHIKRAVACGYDNFDFLERDNDLNNLRQDKRFREYFSDIKSRKVH